MVDFITKYLSVFTGVGSIGLITLVSKIISMYRATEIEKQLETDIQRTFRDIANIVIISFLVFICSVSLVVAIDKKDTINFSETDGQYKISGEILSKKTKNATFVANGLSKSVEIKNNKYDVKLDNNPFGGEKYVLKDNSGKDLLTGVIPTVKEMKRNDIFSNIFYLMLAMIVIVYFYYVIKNSSYKKKLILEDNENFYVVLKSLSNNKILLQKTKKNSNDLYVLENTYRISEKRLFYDKDLVYETSQDVKRRKRITAYITWTNLGIGWIIGFTIFFMTLLVIHLLYRCIIAKEKLCAAMISFVLEFVIVYLFVLFNNYQYHKGKDIINDEKNKYNLGVLFADIKNKFSNPRDTSDSSTYFIIEGEQ